MPLHPDRPYNDLPLLPPRADVETKAVLKSVATASRAVERLRGSARLLPHQQVLIRTIGLFEAKLSSEIENVVTTDDALFRALANADAPTDPATKEVLAYQNALWHGHDVVKGGRPISTPLLEELVSTIKSTRMTVRKMPGVKLLNDSGAIVYTPPDGEHLLRDLLDNMLHYAHTADDVDPLIRMAVMHYQFEAIHPFVDGNGRTGRIVNLLFLVEKGLLDQPVLYLSHYILGHQAESPCRPVALSLSVRIRFVLPLGRLRCRRSLKISVISSVRATPSTLLSVSSSAAPSR